MVCGLVHLEIIHLVPSQKKFQKPNVDRNAPFSKRLRVH